MNAIHRWNTRPALLLALLLVVTPASARITKSRPSASSTAPTTIAEDALWAPLYSTIIGAGIEFERDSEFTEWGFPLLIEYSISETLVVALEPKFVSLTSRSPDEESVRGWSDLETSVVYEFLSERRYRPALSIEGTVKWPTAAREELGEPGHDYTVGLIASKDLVHVEVDFNALYTFAGDAERQDEVELSLAASWHLNPWLDLIGEVSFVSFTDDEAVDTTETEVTVGLAWLVSKHLTLEQGVVFKEHGEWEAIVAWEWSFGGDD